MAYTRTIPEKIITDSRNKNHILAVLANIVKKKGLEGNTIKPIAPSIEQTKNQLIEAATALGPVPAFFASLTQENNRILESFTVAFGHVSNRLYQQYQQDWTRRLLSDTDKTASQIESAIINSHRLLIVEIFHRLIVQALREDSRLTLGVNTSRLVWINIMQDFNETILDESLRGSVHLEDPFRNLLSDLWEKWIPSLEEAVKRLDDIDRNMIVISGAIQSCEQMMAHAKRHLICALVDEREARRSWKGVLTTDKMVSIKLEEVEKKWIDNRLKSRPYVLSDLQIPVLELPAPGSGETKEDLTYAMMDLVAINQLSEQEARYQKIICHFSNDPRVKLLYGLKNRLALFISQLGELGEMMGFFIWLPRFLEHLPFGKLETCMAGIEDCFKELTKKEYLDHLVGTLLHREMVLPGVKAVRVNNPTLSFSHLKSPEWINRVRVYGLSTIKNLLVLGNINKCEILPETITTDMIQSLPVGHEVRVKLETDEREKRFIATSPNISEAGYSPYAAQSSFLEQEIKLPRSCEKTPEIRTLHTIQSAYIREYLRARGVLEKVDWLYNVYRLEVKLNFVVIFEHADNFFRDGKKFSPYVRSAVQKMNEEFLKRHSGSLTVLASKAEEDDWHKEMELLFILKFLCVEAASTGDESHLVWFVERTSKIIPVKPQKRYDILLRALQDKLNELMHDDCQLYSQPKALSLTLVQENERLKNAQDTWVIVTQDQGMQLARNKAEIRNLNDTLLEQQKVGQEKDNIIRKQSKEIEEKDKLILIKEEIIKEKEEAIRNQEIELAKNKALAQDTEKMIKDIRAVSKKKTEEQEATVAQLKKQLQEQNERLAEQILRLAAELEKVTKENIELREKIANESRAEESKAEESKAEESKADESKAGESKAGLTSDLAPKPSTGTIKPGLVTGVGMYAGKSMDNDTGRGVPSSAINFDRTGSL